MVCCFCALFDGIQCHIVIQHHFNGSPTIQHIAADQAVELHTVAVALGEHMEHAGVVDVRIIPILHAGMSSVMNTAFI